MSVYTILTLEQVQHFSQPYALNVTAIQPIQGGMENTNYFLTTTDGKDYVLTIFEELDQYAAATLIPILQHLIQHNIPVAVPLHHHGQAIHTLAHKPAQITPRLIGQHPMQPTIPQAQAMGTALAQLHLTLQHVPLQRHTQHGQAWFTTTLSTLKSDLSDADQQLLEQLLQQLAKQRAKYPNRPQGLIHADLFRENSLFQADTLTAILDFSELTQDELLLDIAISLNDFCSDFPQVKLDPERKQAFLQAYARVRPLTDDEQACLNLYLALAACRFWLARLQCMRRNQLEGRLSQDILQKDPNEMRLMFIDRLVNCQ